MFREKNEWYAAAKPKAFVTNAMKFRCPQLGSGSTQWCSWLRHCATNRKVAASVPGGCIGILSLRQFFQPHYGPGVDSVLTEMSTRNVFGGGAEGGVKATGA